MKYLKIQDNDNNKQIYKAPCMPAEATDGERPPYENWFWP